MSKEGKIELEGIIRAALPNAMFKVEVQGGYIITAQASGRMRTNYIRILPGDKVKIEVSPYDLTRGRIIFRER